MDRDETYGLYPYRWVVLGAFMLVGALTQLMWLNYASIMTQTEAVMGVSELKVTLLMTMFPLLYIPVSIPAGFVIDRKGFRYAVLLGAVLTAGFSFLRLFVTSYPLVLIGMIGISIGQPFVLNSITKTVATWFPTEESALGTGIATLSLFLGMIVAQAATPPLLDAFGGTPEHALRMVVLVYSIAAAAGAVIFALLAKPRPPKPPKRTELELQGETAAINWRSVRAILDVYNFRLLLVIIFIGNGAFVGILQLIEKIIGPKMPDSTAKTISSTAGNIGAVMVVAGVLGCVIIPLISDKLMMRKPFLILAAGVAVPTLILIGVLENITAIYIVSAFAGFFLFSAYPLVLTYAEETTGHALAGTATSILLLLGNAGGVVLTLLMEAVKGGTGGETGSFLWAMLLLAALFVVALVVSLFLHEKPGELAPGAQSGA